MGHSPNQQTQNVTVSATGGPGGSALFTTTTPHTFYSNQPVVLGGTAPTGFTATSVTYYVVNRTDMTFGLAATPSGAAIAASSAGTSVTVGMPTGTFRVLRIHKVVTEQWLTGQANASAAKVAAKDPTQFNQNQFWKKRHVFQFLGNPSATVPYEDEFEYVVSSFDDGT